MRKKNVGAAKRPKTPHHRSSSMKKWPKWSTRTKTMAAVFSQSVLSTARSSPFASVSPRVRELTCDTRCLHRAALVGGGRQVHFLEDERQWQERRPSLNDRATHDRGTKGDGAVVLDSRSLHLKNHVLETVQLQEAVDDTVLAKAHCIPVGA